MRWVPDTLDGRLRVQRAELAMVRTHETQQDERPDEDIFRAVCYEV